MTTASTPASAEPGAPESAGTRAPTTAVATVTARPAADAARQRPRIVMYSHDTMGLGHIRRNLLIAQSLAQAPINAQILLISGIRQAGAFPIAPGVDLVTLPAYRKDIDGNYHPQSLGTDLHALVALRAGLIDTVLQQYPCNLFIVDNVPRGALGELSPVLSAIKARGTTRCVLGLRDVLDTPETVHRQWRKQRHGEAIRDFFDEIWVYGDPELYDTASEYGFDDSIRSRIQQLGYLDPLEHYGIGQAPLPTALDDRYSLCVVGGGQDGWELAETFARSRFPAGEQAVIVCGSRMPEARRQMLANLASTRPHLELLDFIADPISLMRKARRVVAMGGYNTVTELLSLGCQALIVPRVRPRLEQWIRAERLAAMGLIDVLHPDDLSTRTLSNWLASEPPERGDVRRRLRFDGLAQLRQRVADDLVGRPSL